MPTISLPNSWQPRSYQRPAWDYLETGGKRACLVCHRRWGKDDLALHWAATSAFEKVAPYWHMLPKANQARKAIWNAVNPHTGKRRIDEAFPRELRKRTNDTEMFIEFVNGSTWQVVGSDNYDALVGAPPYGIVFSEWALANPAAWAFMSPILAENGGWAVFIYTSRGRNHGYSLYQHAIQSDNWYALRHTTDDTGIISAGALAEDLAEKKRLFGDTIGQALWDQEWFSSFDAAIIGSYYGHLIASAEKEGRIGRVPWEPRIPVRTYWDLGKGDHMAIWFVQMIGREIRVIDYLSGTGVGIPDYVKQIREKPYEYERHGVPHDAKTPELGTQKTRVETMLTLGLKNVKVVPRLTVDDGINAVRMVLPRCWFNEPNCSQGIDALRSYRAEYDEEKRALKPTPLHDWSSHGSDAFRYMAVDYAEEVQLRPPPIEGMHTLTMDDLWKRHVRTETRI